MKCLEYEDNRDVEKLKKYTVKYEHHRKLANKYYSMLRTNSVYTDFLDDESMLADSGYFKPSDM